MLTADHPDVTRFLAAWHENGRAAFVRQYPNGLAGQDYDTYYPKTVKERKKYLALDRGNEHNRSGAFLVDRTTSDVYSIKGYGVPNRKIGALALLTITYERSTAGGVELAQPGYLWSDNALQTAACSSA